MVPHPTTRRRTTGLRTHLGCVLVLLWMAVPAAWSQQGPDEAQTRAAVEQAAPAEPGQPQEAPEALPDAVIAARADLRSGETASGQRAVAVKTLLDAGDLAFLREVLSGEDARAALGLLQALAAQPPASCEPLVQAVLALDARRPGTETSQAADTLLASLAYARPAVLGFLVDSVGPETAPARRRAVLRSLGLSRELGAVEALIGALDSDDADVARDALVTLTGHDLGARAGSVEWTEWWKKHELLGRDQLIELGRIADRQEFEQLRVALEQEVIKARLDTMGHDDVVRLVAGLTDSFAGVRLEAVKRLTRHTNQGQASAAAVPVMLRRLGHPVSAVAGTNGNADDQASEVDGAPPLPPVDPADASNAPDADVASAVLEADPGVRVALVAGLGTLGGARADVRTALISELRGSQGPVVAAAAAGLRLMRDQPSIVVPLLDDLERRPGESNTFDTLQAVASNRPVGVIPRLVPWLGSEQSARVRGAAVRALVASENIGLAMDQLEQLYSSGDTPPDVRFAMAAALGTRVADLVHTPAWERSLRLLASLLDSGEPNVRAEAVAALGRTGTREALDLLDARARNETDPEVIKRIVDAIGTLRLPEGGGVIGRVVANHKDVRDALEPVARESLALIAGQGGPTDWLSLGEAVGGAGAHSLACWCYRELIMRYEAAPESTDAIDRARGRLASDLYLAGQADDALALLLELESEQAPYPSPLERMDLLARASEELGRFSEAADYHLKRFAMLPEGELQRTTTRKAAVDALRKAGRFADALEHLRDLVREEGSDNQLLFDLARTEEAAGQLQQARVDLERLLERIPETDTAFRQDVEAVLARVVRALEGKPPPEIVPGGGDTEMPVEQAIEGAEQAPPEPEAGEEASDDGAPVDEEPVRPFDRTAPAA
ncbi:MAG: tetratricopeptide repeat protein [Planctomycetota bacterium]|jgi:tetratricopeptide (TPR) repeat protein